MAPENDYLTRQDAEGLVRRTVKETLLIMGIDASDPIEMQRDFQALRDWRCAMAAVRSKGLLTIISILIAGIIGLIVLGIKHGVLPKL